MLFKRSQLFSCVGYHGTSETSAKLIMASKFNPSAEESWFGKGIYFFGDLLPYSKGRDEARKWAMSVKWKTHWAVLQVDIESEKTFDVFGNIGDKERFIKMRDEMFKAHVNSGKSEADFEDRIIFKRLEQERYFEVIRAVVDPRKKGYITYVIPQLQVQICVKNDFAIKNKKIIMTGS